VNYFLQMPSNNNLPRCRVIHIRGTVQGVGFRPFVYRLAARLGIVGMVRNDGQGVEIIAFAAPEILDRFAMLLRQEAPPLSAVRNLQSKDMTAVGPLPPAFTIEESAAPGVTAVDIAADTAVCPACLAEMRDPDDRRFGHAFINCTDCGPRYTIIGALPYDRQNTSMAGFAMCPACRAEYVDPASRRFHAQPICCPECGPQYALLDCDGNALNTEDPIASCIGFLDHGCIAAIKGIGGFHLACRADGAETVERLRRLKNREEKPLALMVPDLETASAIAMLSEEEARLLESPERPIVLVRKRSNPGIAIAPGVAKRLPTYGIMLPCAPLHHLLFDRSGLRVLVMTSANRSDEPMVHANDAAVKTLRGIADIFLTHNRTIRVRVDDSVARIVAGAPLLMRRARGYVPDPLPSPCDVTGIIGCGGVLKSTITVGRGNSCYVSQYIGSAENAEALEQASEIRHHLQALLDTPSTLYAIDRHPGTPLEKILEPGVPILRVQHHHAHAAACLAENGIAGKAVCVVYDGTGFGDDGTLWGGEFFRADNYQFRRVGHLSTMLLPGGEAAIEHPWRAALGSLYPLLGSQTEQAQRALTPELCSGVSERITNISSPIEVSPKLCFGELQSLFPEIPADEKRPVLELISREMHCIRSSGMGRLFDAMSALLSVCSRRGYEGQPAILLEAAAMEAPEANTLPGYPVPLTAIGDMAVIDGARILFEAWTDFRGGSPVSQVAARFHATIAEATAAVATLIAREQKIEFVSLSGGCFQNVLLTGRTSRLLRSNGLTPVVHRLLPPSDEAVSYGQVIMAGVERQRDDSV